MPIEADPVGECTGQNIRSVRSIDVSNPSRSVGSSNQLFDLNDPIKKEPENAAPLSPPAKKRRSLSQPPLGREETLNRKTTSQPEQRPVHPLNAVAGAHPSPIESYFELSRSRLESKQSLDDHLDVMAPESAISVSPPGRGPKYGHEFGYLSRVPSTQSGVDADEQLSEPKSSNRPIRSDQYTSQNDAKNHSEFMGRSVSQPPIIPIHSRSSSPPGKFMRETKSLRLSRCAYLTFPLIDHFIVKVMFSVSTNIAMTMRTAFRAGLRVIQLLYHATSNLTRFQRIFLEVRLSNERKSAVYVIPSSLPTSRCNRVIRQRLGI
jgi:hypothetical protein